MKGRLIFSLFILGLFLFLIAIGTVQMSTKAMVFPWTVGGLGLILIVWEIIKIFKAKDAETVEKQKAGVLRKTYLNNILMMLAVVPAIYILGFFVAIPVHVFSFMKINGEKTLLSLSVSLGIALFIYFVLYLFMEIPFYQGRLFLHFVD